MGEEEAKGGEAAEVRDEGYREQVDEVTQAFPDIEDGELPPTWHTSLRDAFSAHLDSIYVDHLESVFDTVGDQRRKEVFGGDGSEILVGEDARLKTFDGAVNACKELGTSGVISEDIVVVDENGDRRTFTPASLAADMKDRVDELAFEDEYDESDPEPYIAKARAYHRALVMLTKIKPAGAEGRSTGSRGKSWDLTEFAFARALSAFFCWIPREFSSDYEVARSKFYGANNSAFIESLVTCCELGCASEIRAMRRGTPAKFEGTARTDRIQPIKDGVRFYVTAASGRAEPMVFLVLMYAYMGGSVPDPRGMVRELITENVSPGMLRTFFIENAEPAFPEGGDDAKKALRKSAQDWIESIPDKMAYTGKDIFVSSSPSVRMFFAREMRAQVRALRLFTDDGIKEFMKKCATSYDDPDAVGAATLSRRWLQEGRGRVFTEDTLRKEVIGPRSMVVLVRGEPHFDLPAGIPKEAAVRGSSNWVASTFAPKGSLVEPRPGFLRALVARLRWAA